MSMSKEGIKTYNSLLQALWHDGMARLTARSRLVRLSEGASLGLSGDPHDGFYFPETALVSLVGETREGKSLELGAVGREGFVGLARLLGNQTQSLWCRVRQSGEAWRIREEDLQRESLSSRSVALSAYVGFRLAELQQGLLCHQFHGARQRMCRWILTTTSRTGMNSVRTTQEGVSALIGVSRPVVSTLIDWLGSRGVVRHERGNITVILAKELEGLACECFRSIETAREEYLATLERMGKKGAQASSADDENPVNSVRHG